jgi:phosphomannomutase
MGIILEFMAATGKKPSELRREIPEYHMIKDKISGTREQASGLIRRLRKKYEGEASLSLLDGLKVERPDHWALIRPSNTEPVIRLQVEARTRGGAEDALARLKKDLGECAPWKS